MFPKLLSKDFGIRYTAGEISATQALFIVRRDACLFASKPASQPSISFRLHTCLAVPSGLCRSHVGRDEVSGDSLDQSYGKPVGDVNSRFVFPFPLESFRRFCSYASFS